MKQAVSVVTACEAPLITCEAVIAESCYLLRDFKGAAEAVLENVVRGVFIVLTSILVLRHHRVGVATRSLAEGHRLPTAEKSRKSSTF